MPFIARTDVNDTENIVKLIQNSLDHENATELILFHAFIYVILLPFTVLLGGKYLYIVKVITSIRYPLQMLRVYVLRRY